MLHKNRMVIDRVYLRKSIREVELRIQQRCKDNCEDEQILGTLRRMLKKVLDKD